MSLEETLIVLVQNLLDDPFLPDLVLFKLLLFFVAQSKYLVLFRDVLCERSKISFELLSLASSVKIYFLTFLRGSTISLTVINVSCPIKYTSFRFILWY